MEYGFAFIQWFPMSLQNMQVGKDADGLHQILRHVNLGASYKWDFGNEPFVFQLSIPKRPGRKLFPIEFFESRFEPNQSLIKLPHQFIL